MVDTATKTNGAKTDAPSTDPTGTYLHTDDHTAVWGTEVPNDTAFSRAWARLFDAGFNMGKPTSREYTLPSNPNTTRQNFQYGYGTLKANIKTSDNDPGSNQNLTVRFSDGRGFIAEESGI